MRYFGLGLELTPMPFSIKHYCRNQSNQVILSPPLPMLPTPDPYRVRKGQNPSVALATSTEPTISLLPLGKALPGQALISQGDSVILKLG